MIPRLYEKTETAFSSYGICPLTDAVSCLVTEERNGGFTLEMTYPRDGRWSNEIIVDRQILADPRDGSAQAEPFRIISVDFDMNGDMLINAEHISYQLNHAIVGAFSGYTRYPLKVWQTATDSANLLTANPFTFQTDISDDNGTVRHYGSELPVALKSVLGGNESSIIDLFGGELEWNRYNVILHSSRGSDNGIKIAYTKNLTGLTYNIDMSSVCSGAVAYYKDTDNYVQGTVQTVTNSYSFNRIAVLDASGEFTDRIPNQSDLNTYASNWLTSNAKTPAVSVEVEFVPLWQTEEYSDVSVLEHVSLCDIVTVQYPPLNLQVKAKVVKTVYDVLRDRYEEITISTIRSSLADTIYQLMR